MITVKIECGCGQRYAFDVEPAGSQMASTVACPVCGADGTAMANAVIASKLVSSPEAPQTATPSGTSLKTSDAVQLKPGMSSGLKTHNAIALGLVDCETAAAEARAKISWGDSQEDVLKYLMLQGYSATEASALVKALFKERLKGLRVKGVIKILSGAGMMCVPVVAWLTHVAMNSGRAMGIVVVVGLWGFWILCNGIILVAAPKMERGDMAE